MIELANYNLKHNPADPKWPDRDRFVLSNGHASMLIYSLLYLTGYDLPLDELKKFRQLHSKTHARDGRFIERLGFFNPIAKGQEVPLNINMERYEHWVGVGGKASDRVKSLVKQFKQQA